MRQRIREKETTRQLISELESHFISNGRHIHPDQLFVQEIVIRPEGETSRALLLAEGKEVCSVTMTRRVNVFTYSEPEFFFSDEKAFVAWRENLPLAQLQCDLSYIHKSIYYLTDFSQEHAAMHLSLHCYRKPGKIHPTDVSRMELRIGYDPRFTMNARYRLKIAPSSASYFSLALKDGKEVVISSMDNRLASMYSKAHCPPTILGL